MELHGFSDVSQHALGAAVYIRVLDELYNARVSLVAAKSKVAPLKTVTIPRLELSAAVLLVRLVSHVRTALHLEAVPVHLWVDSTVALTWLKGHPSRWKDFIANRVALIQELAPSARWHHVAGSENPADCASRGLPPKSLEGYQLWWTGPPWLSHTSSSWPSATVPLNSDCDLEERPSRVILATSQPSSWDLVNRYSKLTRKIRVTAWLIRAISHFNKFPTSNHTRALTPSEIHDPEIFWIKQTQAEYFSDEITTIIKNKRLAKSHSLLRLLPFVDEHGILRVGGRLRNSHLEPDAKHPIVLPRESAHDD